MFESSASSECACEKREGAPVSSRRTPHDLTGVFNFTYVHSVVELDDVGVQTSKSRPLANQSPYILNLALDYQHEKTGTSVRLLYNVFGPRIAQVGAFDLPDVYEQPRNVLDLTASQRAGNYVTFKLTVENILNAPYRFTHGVEGKDESLVNRYRVGTSAMLYATIANN